MTEEFDLPTLFPDADLERLVTGDLLAICVPRAGSTGLIPMLEAHTLNDSGEREVHVFTLATDDYNDTDGRRQTLALVGQRLAEQTQTVLAIRFASEAWMTRLTEEEWALKGARQAGDYPQREEVILVVVETLDQRRRSTTARLYRRPGGKVDTIGAWDTQRPQGAYFGLLKAFWTAYAREVLQRSAGQN